MKHLPLLALFFSQSILSAAPVIWTSWTSATSGPSGSAAGTITIGLNTVNVTFSGESTFVQTNGVGTNYWDPSGPYISGLVDNAPPNPDIIAMSTATTRTLTFSQAVDNLFFAFVSFNGNSAIFDHDFQIVSGDNIAGYWGAGTTSKSNPGPGQFQLAGSGEAHGVIQFIGPITSITWTNSTFEDWNGFSVGTYGLASETPEPSTWALAAVGLVLVGLQARGKRGSAE